MKLSIVTTIYKSAGVVDEFFERSVEAAEKMGLELQVVFVNDGSPDNGLEVARRLTERDARVTLVDLSRNVGQHRALWTGIRYAEGDLIAIMDGDMEEDPVWLADCYRQMVETESDVVYGLQQARKGSLFYRTSRNIFYQMLSATTSADFPRNVTTFRLMTRRYVDALKEFSEREIFLVGIMHMAGFKQTGFLVSKISRSPTTYSLSRLTFVFITHTTSFSIKPLIFVFASGLALLFLSLVLVALLLSLSIAGMLTVPGWASTIAIVTFFCGIMLSFNGILAIYIGTIFLEVKQRPVAIVRKVYSANRSQGDI